jgi:hypothetical protein
MIPKRLPEGKIFPDEVILARLPEIEFKANILGIIALRAYACGTGRA